MTTSRRLVLCATVAGMALVAGHASAAGVASLRGLTRTLTEDAGQARLLSDGGGDVATTGTDVTAATSTVTATPETTGADGSASAAYESIHAFPWWYWLPVESAQLSGSSN